MKNARTGDRGNQRGQQRNSGSGAKNLRPDGCFQNEISDCPRCPRHGSAKCPPLLRPRRERAGSKARKPAAHPCGEARVRAGQHIVIHGQRCQPAQQQREPKPGQAGCRRTRERRQPFLFRIQKNTPCRTYASQHIPAGGESLRKQLYTSGPFGSSCFGSSFFVSFAFCLAALRSCASLAACASARAFVEMAHLATWMRT